MICNLCPRHCNLKEGDRGFCFVRQNRGGEMVLTTYGKSTGFCIDPIEKKPLNHFFPGTSVLSFGTAGCNLGCKFCQNHDISKAREVELLSEHAMPATIARAAAELGCQSVAYTYNDPIIWAEYAIDTARECRALGIKSVAVTAGYITPQARQPFFEFFDAANVDLKAFTEEFYEQLTLSHLQPVLDTLQWLKQETDVWFEITNLIIPDANDSPAELRELCDWVLRHVGDEVPIHFSAFHPDFRLLDRPNTPHETLLAAYDIARRTGLKYVYVGNVHDFDHQSTYCASCGKLVIERDWYQLGEYHLRLDQCSHCGHKIPGRFAKAPGSWGRKRQPIKIASYGQQGAETVSSVSTSTDPALQLSDAQQAAVHQAACEFVAAAVTGREPALPDPSIAGRAEQPVMGVYVSLKRDGRLRGCCGFTGQATPLAAGLRHSAYRTATEDVRLPPVSPTELPFLEIEVWLLQGMLPVTEVGQARAAAIKIGRDGLLISRGQQRGLLLPGVATENDFDAEAFLRQVCLKAKLPATAWLEKDTVLQRFEGLSIKAHFDSTVLAKTEVQARAIVDDQAIQPLAGFCRQNVEQSFRGAVPTYYIAGVSDGMINGAVVTAHLPDGRLVHAPKISLRPPIPMQSTLFELSQGMSKLLQRVPCDPAEIKLELTIFEDPAMHGTVKQPDLRGIDSGRSILVLGPNRSAWRFDPSATPEATCQALRGALSMRSDQLATLYSFRTHATQPLEMVSKPTPQRGPVTRPSAVAGTFYPAEAGALSSMVRTLLPKEKPATRPWRAAMVPHAGLRFSGAIAAQVLAHIEVPRTVIVIGPKHTRHGVDWAVAPHDTWSLPGITLANDSDLVKQLSHNIQFLEPDAVAHQQEHAIEVELPLLHHFAPESRVVGIALGGGDLETCRLFASGLAQTLRERSDPTLLLISSDMNHFASDEQTRLLDELAIQALETLDPAKVLSTVRQNEISMCGVLPAVVVLEALNELKPLTEAHRVAYGTSADLNGKKDRVVGYAGMLFD